MVKRQQPFSQRLIICHRHWNYNISTEVRHLCFKSIINYDLGITNILVLFPQIRYIEVFDITNLPFNEQIWPVPSDFIKSRFHCKPFSLFEVVIQLCFQCPSPFRPFFEGRKKRNPGNEVGCYHLGKYIFKQRDGNLDLLALAASRLLLKVPMT